MKTGKKMLSFLLCLILAAGLFPAARASDGGAGVAFCLCDTAAGWSRSSGNFAADGEIYTEAPASLRYETDLTQAQTDTFVIHYQAPAPVDATGYDYFELDLYLENPDLFGLGGGQLELTSSGECDVEELAFDMGYLSRQDLRQGWNHLCLPLSAGALNSQTDRQFDPSAVNFLRLYISGLPASVGEVVLRFDNMFFTDGQGGSLPSAGPGDYTPPAQEPAVDGRSYGDLDGSGAPDSADALLVLQYSVDLVRLDYEPLALADVDASGSVNASDALQILQRSVALTDRFSIEEGYEGAQRTEVGVNGPHLVHTIYPTEEAVVAITDVIYWGAHGDGVTDDTLAFQKALAYAEAQGGGTVFVPAGRYALRGNLSIPNGVTLKGDAPTQDTGEVEGTILLAYAGRGQETGAAFLSMYIGSGVENLSIYYPEQRMEDIVPYPWTIDMTEVHGICVQNVRLVNSYQGIRLGNGNGNALQNIRGLVGTVLKTGLYIDYNVDICRLENIRFTPACWIGSGLSSTGARQAMEDYVYANATGFKIEMVDWTYLADITVEGCAVGIHTSQSTQRENGGSPNGQMYDIHLLDCATGLYLEYVNAIGMMITKGEITSQNPVVLSPDFETSLSLHAMTLRSTGAHALVNEGAGAVTLGSCTVEMDPAQTAGQPCALSCQGGRMSVLDTVFSGPGSHVEAVGCEDISLINCRFDGDPLLAGDTSRIRLAEDDTLVSPSLPASLEYAPVRETKPSGDHFINVLDAPYSAAPSTVTGCSSAIQQAIDDVHALGGGVVYVPAGVYTLDQPITVRPGVELRGSSDAPHHSQVSSTVFYTDSGRGDEEGEALITLEGRAGVNGFKVMYTGQGSGVADIVPYAATIRGKGINVYILNVDLINPYIGVDLDTYRCDGHAVNGLTGAPLRHGVVAGGGSVDGLVRDVQFNPHYYGDNSRYGLNPQVTTDSVFEYQMHHAETFVVRDTYGEVMFHNFVYGALSGLSLEDGADVTVLGHGTDGGNQSLTASGTPKQPITLINSQLVVFGAYGDIMTYIRLAEDFTGRLNLIQTNLWGSPARMIEALGGAIHMTQGNVSSSGTLGIVNFGADTAVSGMKFSQDNPLYDWYLDFSARSACAFGNLYASNGGQGLKYDAAGVMRGTDFGA